MLFYQTYSFDEYQFGRQTIRFAVSDTYAELLTTSGTATDIFSLGSIKQDLNLSEGEFAIDELNFSVNSCSCRAVGDRNALYFALEAKSRPRYCAVFLYASGGTPSASNQLFLGKIDSKVSAEDLHHAGTAYAVLISPEREYKFTAKSLDLSLLEECTFNGNCYDDSSVRVSNIYERLKTDDWAGLKAITFDGYCLTLNDTELYSLHLVSLRQAIELYLTACSEMLLDMHDLTVNFNFANTSIGIKGSPTYYTLTEGTYSQVTAGQYTRNDTLFELFTDTAEVTQGTDQTRRLVIDGRLVYANLDRPFWTEGYDVNLSANETVARDRFYIERGEGFYTFGNVSALLFGIARALGCYVRTTQTINGSALNVAIEFIPRSGLVETDLTYFYGSASASIETGRTEANEANKFFARANDMIADGDDKMEFYLTFTGTDDLEKTPKLKSAEEARGIEKTKYNTDFEKLALSTSQTIFRLMPTLFEAPLNALPVSNAGTPNRSVADTYKACCMLTSAIYTDEVNITYDTRTDSAGVHSRAYRPISRIYTKVDGETVKDKKGDDGIQLSDYINLIASREKTYYETEYSLTVPYWNGFSKNANGSNADYTKLKLGSITEINETIRRYSNGGWEDYTPATGTVFVVVSREIFLDKPETQIKMQNAARFAYGIYTATTSEVINAGSHEYFTDDGADYGTATIATGETVHVGDAVGMNANGLLFKSYCLHTVRDTFCGIVVDIDTNGNVAKYQKSGIIKSDAYSFASGASVYVRTSALGVCNVSQSYLGNESSATEDLIIRLGYALTATSFLLCPSEYNVLPLIIPS